MQFVMGFCNFVFPVKIAVPVHQVVASDGIIKVGDFKNIAHTSASICVEKLSVGHTRLFSGNLLDTAGNITDIQVSGPVTGFTDSTVQPSKEAQSLARLKSKTSFNLIVSQHALSYEERLIRRQEQFSVLLHGHVRSALNLRGTVYHAVIGMIEPELDFPMLNLDIYHRTVYGYRNSNIHLLDKFLSPCWDLVLNDNGPVKFVCQVSFSVVRCISLSLSIKTVVWNPDRELSKQEYRQQIQSFIKSSPVLDDIDNM